ncbi:hypothetical protein PC128_g25349 [Phytophthora cactorum]|nr:hypothetical protein PC128_g25349 [Phytophthora cactorum]
MFSSPAYGTVILLQAITRLSVFRILHGSSDRGGTRTTRRCDKHEAGAPDEWLRKPVVGISDGRCVELLLAG